MSAIGGEATIEAVAIDGPAGSGKSSAARRIAAARGYLYVDTGAMYRAVALAALRRGIDPESPDALFALFKDLDITFDASGERLLLGGADVSDDIRSPEVARTVKFAARHPAIRAGMVAAQRAMADRRPVVMEGRDIATVVLPGARWKFFLTARPKVRARRRHAEMLAAGRQAVYEEILEDIRRRDESDFQVGPMREALDLAKNNGGIELVDTSDMTPDETVRHILNRM